MNTLTFGKLAGAPFFFMPVNAQQGKLHQFTGISTIPIPDNKAVLADYFTGSGSINLERPSFSNRFFISFYPLLSSHEHNSQIASIRLKEHIKAASRDTRDGINGQYNLGQGAGQPLFTFDRKNLAAK